jgi:polyferredoxin
MLNRRITQGISLLLLHSSWGPELKWLCNPVLSCHSCALAWFACPVGVFVQYSGNHLFPFFALGTILLVGVLVGRLFCGWVCPFGFVQDVLHKIRTPKFELPERTGKIKYAVLIVMVFLLPFFFGGETMLSFCRICPASALQVTIPNWVSGGFHAIPFSTGVKLSVLAVVLATVIFSSRAFCKTLCPIGAMMAGLNYVSFWKIPFPGQSCSSCRECDEACPTHVRPSSRISKGIPVHHTLDCIVCHDCQKSCSKQRH